jgi:hypothetical protein
MIRKLLLFMILFAPLAQSGPMAIAAEEDEWGYCVDGKAYGRFNGERRKESADWVCQLPLGTETGEASVHNTQRCRVGQKSECKVGAGGADGVRGDHNVPGNAFYVIPGANTEFPLVRCQCGCFTGDVAILTTGGYQTIADLSQRASRSNVQVATVKDGGLAASGRLRNPDFTVGPEEKPVLRITTETGLAITLTDGHPVVVERDGARAIVQAKQLRDGDLVVTSDDETTAVIGIDPVELPEGDNLVYNFDTKGATAEGHVIIANGLQVGDLHWQKRLSEEEARVEAILHRSSEL